jgi:CRP-like cAMP-binding protein
MWMILGVTINAAIIGNVANIVVNIDSDSSVFFTKTDDIKNYMFDFQISKQLQNKVDCYLASLWDHRATLVEESFVQGLPLSLRIQATESTRQRHISSCPFFDFCSSEIVKTLSLRLKLLLFSAGDIIIHYGDMGAEMYFLERGTVDVVSGDGETVFATLAANTESMGHRSAFFGETALFFKQKRNSTVRATSFCEVYELHKKCLDDELKQRDFDLNRMLKVFTKIADSNKQRNHAVMENLKLSKSIHSKLNKMIDLTLNATSGRKINPYFIPNSIFRTGWDLIRIVLVVYIIVVLPFRAAFHDEHISGTMHSLLTWHILDFCIDGFFIVDIYCRNFLFPITVNGVIIINKDTICERYKQNGRTYDLLASLPFELLLLLIEDSRYLLYLRLFHMIRIINLPSYLTLCENYLNLYNIRINAAKKLLMKMFFCYVLVNHWCACIWFMIHRYLERHTQYTWATTDCPEGQEPASNGCLAVWNENTLSHNVCDGNQIHKCYIRSIYFVLTTTSTVGYGKHRNYLSI